MLNATADVHAAFLDGYYAGDGLKTRQRRLGHDEQPGPRPGPRLALRLHGPAGVGLHRAARRTALLPAEPPSEALRSGAQGQHLRKDPSEVRRIVEVDADRRRRVRLRPRDRERRLRRRRRPGRRPQLPPPWAGVRDAQDHLARRGDQARPARQELHLGNLDAERDWGYAKDYVEAMWLMLQQDAAEDYVIATNTSNTVRECVRDRLRRGGPRRLREVRRDRPGLRAPGRGRPAHRRATTRPRSDLGWKPETTFEELIRLMTKSDLELLKP